MPSSAHTRPPDVGLLHSVIDKNGLDVNTSHQGSGLEDVRSWLNKKLRMWGLNFEDGRAARWDMAVIRTRHRGGQEE